MRLGSTAWQGLKVFIWILEEGWVSKVYTMSLPILDACWLSPIESENLYRYSFPFPVPMQHKRCLDKVLDISWVSSLVSCLVEGWTIHVCMSCVHLDFWFSSSGVREKCVVGWTDGDSRKCLVFRPYPWEDTVGELCAQVTSASSCLESSGQNHTILLCCLWSYQLGLKLIMDDLHWSFFSHNIFMDARFKD